MASSNRVAYSPGEFAELFGKSQTWGYRQIYAGKVNAITEHGRVLIPAKEVERVLESAGIYKGREKPKTAKARQQSLSAEQQSIWQRFVRMRQELGGTSPVKKKAKRHGDAELIPKWKAENERKALHRIARSWARPD